VLRIIGEEEENICGSIHGKGGVTKGGRKKLTGGDRFGC